jgi:hypothetical protein
MNNKTSNISKDTFLTLQWIERVETAKDAYDWTDRYTMAFVYMALKMMPWTGMMASKEMAWTNRFINNLKMHFAGICTDLKSKSSNDQYP